MYLSWKKFSNLNYTKERMYFLLFLARRMSFFSVASRLRKHPVYRIASSYGVQFANWTETHDERVTKKTKKERRPWCIHYDCHGRGHRNCEQFLRQPGSFSDEIETKRQLFTLRLRLDCFLFAPRSWFRFHCLASLLFSIISERHRERNKKICFKSQF